MSYLLTVIVFVLVFSLLVLIHELGHFVMAKRAGIKVEEFGFGLPPRIWGVKKGETIYSINWIPFGGFVRMLGEDAGDPKLLKAKRSFIAQPARARILVVIAGVVMNFFLAWLLLGIGFSVGMQPLLTPDDVLPAVERGEIVLEEGLKVKAVEDGSLADQAGLEADDRIISYNGEVIDFFSFHKILDDPRGQYEIERSGSRFNLNINDEGSAGIQFYDATAFPRVEIFDVDKDSASYRYGLRSGDVILTVNDKEIFDVEDFEEVAGSEEVLDFVVYRDGVEVGFLVEQLQTAQVIVSEVLPDAPAAKAGVKARDVILSVNGKRFSSAEDLVEYVDGLEQGDLAYRVLRDGEEKFFTITPEEGKIGVYLSDLNDYGNIEDVSIFNTDLLSSVVEIKEEQYPVPKAFVKAFSEGYRMSKLTAILFVDFVGDLINGREVSENVAGPVRIAQMTHVFVQEGIVPLLRFVAILSLSLAVINILPFPALDGGRLLFILIEILSGRKVNQRLENLAHVVGYVLLLLLIVVVTYSDILSLLRG